ncbi:hypothetical protein [Palleronia abyssalis]|uniref:Uncharacterized protein n=1 Tax=Palleronia abyssalis TaxID=1501240 RepID=A0A2R8BVL8_9RHOB|nr:hypothetical protein [Palleronia abyssalis]SPJ24170.1 hypothetical protein PAA8504_01998 [Palleronia abyssalis]
MLLPFGDMFTGALRGREDIFAAPPNYFPGYPQWNVYARVFDKLPMGRWFFDLIVVTTIITAL